MVVECAWSSDADYLVTHNTRDFTQAELTGFRFGVVTPAQFMTAWRESR